MIKQSQTQVVIFEHFLRSAGRTKPLAALALSLAIVFWVASFPIARAATGKTPAEMIQSYLPHPMSLANASDSDVLSATRKAVQGSPQDAPAIVRTVAGARRELTGEIMKIAVDSLKTKKEPDCEIARSVLHQAITVNGDQAAALTEMFVNLCPTCADSPEEGPANLSNINGAPGTVSGGRAAGTGTCSVCHNNQSIQVNCSNLGNYLASHPGDTAGACEATPNANK
jgi:hypothetical protein